MKINKAIVLSIILAVAVVSPLVASAQAGQVFLDIIRSITDLAMNLLIGVGVLFLVLAGFMFLFARGDESKLSQARTMLLWSVIGIAVGALAPVFVGLATDFVGQWW